jgi:hypothetical protein
MKKNRFPPGWSDARVRRVIARYESQTDLEAIAEDEAAYEAAGHTMMEVPRELVPTVRQLIAERSKRPVRRTRGRRAKKSGNAAHAKATSKRKYSLAELVRGVTKRNRHPEIDFGPPMGKELL